MIFYTPWAFLSRTSSVISYSCYRFHEFHSHVIISNPISELIVYASSNVHYPVLFILARILTFILRGHMCFGDVLSITGISNEVVVFVLVHLM